MARDRPGLRAQYEALSRTPGLARLVLCHGDTIEVDAATALQAAAATL